MYQDAGNLWIGGAVFNWGVFEIQNDTSIKDEGPPGTFMNMGTVTKTQGAVGGRTTFYVPFSNYGALLLNGFTLSYQWLPPAMPGMPTAGNAFAQFSAVDPNGVVISKTVLDGGTLIAAGSAGCVLNGGYLYGPGAIQGTLSNFGGWVVTSNDVNTPIMLVTGNYVELPGATLEIAAWANQQFSGLFVSGQAWLGGNLYISAVGGYTPRNGDGAMVLVAAGGVNPAFDDVLPEGWSALYYPLCVDVVWIGN